MRIPKVLLVLAIVAGCGGSAAPSAPSSGPSAGPTAPPATPTPGPSAAPTGPVDDVSIASILGVTASPPAGTTWIRVSDPGVGFTYEVPATWTTSAGYPWEAAGATVGVVLAAGPDITKLGSDFSVAGVAIGVSANPSGQSARAAVEAESNELATCTGSAVEDISEPTITAAYQLRDHCAGETGFLVILAIVPVGGRGLIGVTFQGSTEADLGYLDHIIASIAEVEPGSQPTPAPSLGATSGEPYAISMTICVNQHGQGVAEGLIRNDDTQSRVFRIEVWFFDLAGVLLNTTDWTTSELPPGVTARWQAEVPSGLPPVDVQCTLHAVEVVR